MTGTVGILNVGAGDTKLVFDKTNPAETIRAARIVKDMLRRGYALLVEVEDTDGAKAYRRALDFDENTAEYIIADFDPGYPAEGPGVDIKDHSSEAVDAEVEAALGATTPTGTAPPAPIRRRGVGRRRIAAADTKAVAVARTSGG